MLLPPISVFRDWREKRDILRCNPQFQEGACYACFVINTSPTSLGRLQASFTSRDNDKKEGTVDMVRLFQLSSWKPRTGWDGYHVFAGRG